MADTLHELPQRSLLPPPPTHQIPRRSSLYAHSGIAAISLPSLSQGSFVAAVPPLTSPPSTYIRSRSGSPAARMLSLCDSPFHPSHENTLVAGNDFLTPATSDTKDDTHKALKSTKTLSVDTTCITSPPEEGDEATMADDESKYVQSPTSYGGTSNCTVPLEPCSPTLMSQWVYERNVIV